MFGFCAPSAPGVGHSAAPAQRTPTVARTRERFDIGVLLSWRSRQKAGFSACVIGTTDVRALFSRRQRRAAGFGEAGAGRYPKKPAAPTETKPPPPGLAKRRRKSNAEAYGRRTPGIREMSRWGSPQT